MELIDIPWLPESYKLDKYWNIFSVRKVNPCKNRDWYLSVKIWDKSYLAHRIIWITLIENQYNKEQINHINWIKHDNRLENLEWCTRSENMKHAYRMWLAKSNFKKGVWWSNMIKAKKVIQYDLMWNFIKEFQSTREAERMTWVSNQTIWYCTSWKQKKAWWFIWKYKN